MSTPHPPILQDASRGFKSERLPEMTQQLDINIARLNDQLAQVHQSLEEGVFIDPQYFHEPASVLQELEGVQEKVTAMANMARTYSEYQELFNIETYAFKNLTKTQETFERQEHVWKTVAHWNEQCERWMNEDFLKVNVEDMNKDVNVYFKESYAFHKKLNNEVTLRLKEGVNDLKVKMGAVMELGNPAMRPRHWEKLFKLLNQTWWVRWQGRRRGVGR